MSHSGWRSKHKDKLPHLSAAAGGRHLSPVKTRGTTKSWRAQQSIFPLTGFSLQVCAKKGRQNNKTAHTHTHSQTHTLSLSLCHFSAQSDSNACVCMFVCGLEIDFPIFHLRHSMPPPPPLGFGCRDLRTFSSCTAKPKPTHTKKKNISYISDMCVFPNHWSFRNNRMIIIRRKTQNPTTHTHDVVVVGGSNLFIALNRLGAFVWVFFFLSWLSSRDKYFCYNLWQRLRRWIMRGMSIFSCFWKTALLSI